ncbi:MAG: PIG-L family deacetylase, partial [Bacteroidaceae bacterium]|nr:PIG-L family deacetylase [Bacteroidaceae bacterium]
MKYLLVIAHPDDEILGAGASISLFAKKGEQIAVCIMSSEAKARAFRPSDDDLVSNLQASSSYIGINEIIEGNFPNIEMNTVPHLQLVKFIELAIIKTEPDVIITHHPSDVNNDHMQTSFACQEAFRLFQRRIDIKPISQLWFMEVLSSTEWSVNSAINHFNPNVFVEVGEENLNKKINALSLYKGV